MQQSSELLKLSKLILVKLHTKLFAFSLVFHFKLMAINLSKKGFYGHSKNTCFHKLHTRHKICLHQRRTIRYRLHYGIEFIHFISFKEKENSFFFFLASFLKFGSHKNKKLYTFYDNSKIFFGTSGFLSTSRSHIIYLFQTKNTMKSHF